MDSLASRSYFDRVPNEIVVSIVKSDLLPQEIATCRTLCRRFKVLIDKDASLTITLLYSEIICSINELPTKKQKKCLSVLESVAHPKRRILPSKSLICTEDSEMDAVDEPSKKIKLMPRQDALEYLITVEDVTLRKSQFQAIFNADLKVGAFEAAKNIAFLSKGFNLLNNGSNNEQIAVALRDVVKVQAAVDLNGAKETALMIKQLDPQPESDLLWYAEAVVEIIQVEAKSNLDAAKEMLASLKQESESENESGSESDDESMSLIPTFRKAENAIIIATIKSQWQGDFSNVCETVRSIEDIDQRIYAFIFVFKSLNPTPVLPRLIKSVINGA